ncbi:MAG: pseudoazurin [Rhodobacterales bacterium]|nr:MAG: pseudoazurin [Rhodobacterales bacterium]
MFRKLTAATAVAVALAAPAWAETFEVQMLNKGDAGAMVYEPDFLRIAPGDTVKFVATDKGHSAETMKGMVPEGGETFTGKINEEVEVTFNTEGFYGIKCKPHFAMGMVMTIAVGDGAAPEDFLGGKIPKKAMKRFEAQLENLSQ